MKNRRTHTLIALTGGIGAGKSVVAKALRALGYPVFDCDSEAKALMDASDAIKARLRAEIDAATVLADGSIDRKALAAIVFADNERLAILNNIVHTAVKERLAAWAEVQASELVFVETAIMYESGLNDIVDEEWHVDAPEGVRISRVMKRNNLSSADVKKRIEAQQTTPAPGQRQPLRYLIINDGTTPVLPRLANLLSLKTNT